MRRGPTAMVMLIALAGAFVACTPDDESAGPARYLPVDSEVCAVAIGDVMIDPWLVGPEEVAEVAVPDGALRAWRGPSIGDRDSGPDDIVIGDIRVSLGEHDGQVSAWWFEEDELLTSVGTDALDADAVEEMLPDLVAASGLAAVADVVVDSVAGASVTYVGPPPRYDTAVGAPNGVVFGSGDPSSAEAAGAYFGQQPEAELVDGVWSFTIGAPISATPATVVPESMDSDGVTVEEVGAGEFVDVLDGLAEGPMRLVQGSPLVDKAFRCGSGDDMGTVELAGPEEVAAVSAQESGDGTWSVDVVLVADDDRPGVSDLYTWLVLDFGPRVRFVTELPVATSPEPRTVDEVTFDDLTRQEAEFLIERLSESAPEGS
jgi:hypothetical protein